jgi:ubiquinone/menaquinone biosynthesis C-methylase UbiE
MIVQAVDYLASVSPVVRRLIWRHTYQGINRTFADVNWSFLNYGYASLDPGVPLLPLETHDEPDRDFIQLYHHVAATVELAGKEVLEVSSGRGGGSSFLARYLGPRRLIGLDRSESAVAFCEKRYRSPNLAYRVGDAESLPFGEASFDAVVNVESSHCYGSLVQFLREVRRVLRPGGWFLWADFRERQQLPALDDAFTSADLAPVRQEDITPNVLASLDGMHERKLEAIHAHAPRLLIPLLKEFAGIRGSTIYQAFETREKFYRHYACRKGT